MKGVLYVLSGLAALGWLAMLITSVATFLGRQGPLDGRVEVFAYPPFVVLIPAVIASGWLSRDFPRKDTMKAIFRGCPAWIMYVTYGSLAYAALNLLLDIAGHRGTAAQAMRLLCAVMMAVYAVAFSILYSAATLWGRPQRRCPLGHAVGPLAKFCDQCRRPIVDLADGPQLH